MNQDFSLALHILTFLDLVENNTSTSEIIASSIQTNPVVVRRSLAKLKKAGFIKTKRGHGGITLIKKAQLITIYEVYVLTVERFVNIKSYEHNECPVGKFMHDSINCVLDDTFASIEKTLSNKTIKDISNNILKNIEEEK